MSEAEKRLRDQYKQNRQKWIQILALCLAVLTVLTVTFSIIHSNVKDSNQVNYVEKSDIDYTVVLKENEFYDTQFLNKDMTYIASLIDGVVTELTYDLSTDASGVDYEYSYVVETVLRVEDNSSKEAILEKVETLKTVDKQTQSADQKLSLKEVVVIDYEKYNDVAQSFVETYDLKNTTNNTLQLRLRVQVYSTCDELENKTINDHVVALKLPLTNKTVDIKLESAIPEATTKSIVCGKATGKVLFAVLAIVFASLDVIHLGFTIAFIYLTRNHDIAYEGTVNKIVAKYKSYIQKINNEFVMDGYQILHVNTFGEMLEIRETIQEPILMYENEDQTRSDFIIPTNTNLLYLFAVKVADYDERYKVVEEPVEEETIVEEPEAEPVFAEVVEEETVEEVIEEPIEEEPAPEPEPENKGVEVIGVIWPERRAEHKIYRYDPDGETVGVGDIVLVPSRDESSKRDIIREAEVAEGNYWIDPETLKHPLKKIIRVVKRKAEDLFNSMILNESVVEEILEPEEETPVAAEEASDTVEENND